ncbi:MAG TPA: hypothetical protein VI814_04880 [Candidatus Limnocylindria bacterium]
MLSRRRLLVPFAAATFTYALAAIVPAARAAAARRPAAWGTSATRCAQCGAQGHTMLDPRCPRAPRVT